MVISFRMTVQRCLTFCCSWPSASRPRSSMGDRNGLRAYLHDGPSEPRNYSGDGERQCARRRGIHDRRFGVIALAVWEPRQAPLLEARTCGDDRRRAWGICSDRYPRQFDQAHRRHLSWTHGGYSSLESLSTRRATGAATCALIGFVGGFLDAVGGG